MILKETAKDTLLWVHDMLLARGIDYRLTGLPAVNLYGYGIGTNVIDLAVESDEIVEEAVKTLGLPWIEDRLYKDNLYIFGVPDETYWVRIQGDILGEPFKHPIGIYLHSKELLLRRLEIYSKYNTRIIKACAFIALTVDKEKTEKYKDYWNRL